MAIKAKVDGFISDMKSISMPLFTLSPARKINKGESEGKNKDEKMKTKFLSAWNNIRYDLGAGASLKKDVPIWILGVCHHSKAALPDSPTEREEGEMPLFDSDLAKRVFTDLASRPWLTYRKNFPPIPGTDITSDTGWGCMLRTAQMMVAQGLILHFLGREWSWYRKQDHHEEHTHRKILGWFIDDPSDHCPLSVHHLAQIGRRFGSTPGNWYGPNTVAYIMQQAVETAQEKITELKEIAIYVAQDCTVYSEDVYDLCGWRNAENSTFSEQTPEYTDSRRCSTSSESLSTASATSEVYVDEIGSEASETMSAFFVPRISAEESVATSKIVNNMIPLTEFVNSEQFSIDIEVEEPWTKTEDILPPASNLPNYFATNIPTKKGLSQRKVTSKANSTTKSKKPAKSDTDFLSKMESVDIVSQLRDGDWIEVPSREALPQSQSSLRLKTDNQSALVDKTQSENLETVVYCPSGQPTTNSANISPERYKPKIKLYDDSEPRYGEQQTRITQNSENGQFTAQNVTETPNLASESKIRNIFKGLATKAAENSAPNKNSQVGSHPNKDFIASYGKPQSTIIKPSSDEETRIHGSRSKATRPDSLSSQAGKTILSRTLSPKNSGSGVEREEIACLQGTECQPEAISNSRQETVLRKLHHMERHGLSSESRSRSRSDPTNILQQPETSLRDSSIWPSSTTMKCPSTRPEEATEENTLSNTPSKDQEESIMQESKPLMVLVTETPQKSENYLSEIHPELHCDLSEESQSTQVLEETATSTDASISSENASSLHRDEGKSNQCTSSKDQHSSCLDKKVMSQKRKLIPGDEIQGYKSKSSSAVSPKISTFDFIDNSDALQDSYFEDRARKLPSPEFLSQYIEKVTLPSPSKSGDAGKPGSSSLKHMNARRRTSSESLQRSESNSKETRSGVSSLTLHEKKDKEQIINIPRKMSTKIRQRSLTLDEDLRPLSLPEELVRIPRKSSTKSTSIPRKSSSSYKAALILVPVRLGESTLNPIYAPCIEAVLSLESSIGIIGGKPRHSLYFVGFQGENLIHLDPHYCQPADTPTGFRKNLHDYHTMSVRKINVRKIDPSCCFGFYCRTSEEFENFKRQGQKIFSPPKQSMSYPMCIIMDGKSDDHHPPVGLLSPTDTTDDATFPAMVSTVHSNDLGSALGVSTQNSTPTGPTPKSKGKNSKKSRTDYFNIDDMGSKLNKLNPFPKLLRQKSSSPSSGRKRTRNVAEEEESLESQFELL